MSDTIKKLDRATPHSLKEGGDDPSSSQEIASLQEVFKVLVKAIKNLKIYQANNPVHQRFLKEFYTKVDHHLKTYGDSILTVGQYTLTCLDQTIYENLNRLDSLAFKLFVDGIRQMTLMEGITEEESGHFLEVLGRSYDAERPDDDLVTLFWQKKFHHVKFQIIEDYFSDETNMAPVSEPEAKAGLNSMVQAELGSQGAEKTAPENSKSKTAFTDEQISRFQVHQVFRLTEDEILKIKNEMKLETEKDLITELVNIIYSVLQIEKDEVYFKEVVDLLVKNTTHLIEEGDLVQVEKVTRLLVSLKEQIPPIPAKMVEILDQAIVFIGNPEYLNKIETHLNTLDEKNLSSLSNFLRMMGVTSSSSIIDILSKAKIRKTRKILSDILVEFGKRDLGPILSRLQGSQWYVIRNLVQIIGQIGSHQAIESLNKLVQYPDERVRKEIVYSLMLIGKENERAKDIILTFLNDHDSGIRKQVIQIIQTNKYEKAYPVLYKMISGDDEGIRDSEERYLIFSALGKLGNKDLLPILKEYLTPTFLSFIKKNKKEDQAICALYALRYMDYPESEELLKEARKHPYKLVSDFASKALYEKQKAKEKKELKSKDEIQKSD